MKIERYLDEDGNWQIFDKSKIIADAEDKPESKRKVVASDKAVVAEVAKQVDAVAIYTEGELTDMLMVELKAIAESRKLKFNKKKINKTQIVELILGSD